MTAVARYSRKPSHAPVAFGLCTIGNASLPTQDVHCSDCAHSHRMQANAWRSCAAGHPPHRANEPHQCADWQRATEVNP